MSLTQDTPATVVISVPVDVNGLHDADYRAAIVKKALKNYAKYWDDLSHEYWKVKQFEHAQHAREHAHYLSALVREIRVDGEDVIL